jgi:hypothetical protein
LISCILTFNLCRLFTNRMVLLDSKTVLVTVLDHCDCWSTV